LGECETSGAPYRQQSGGTVPAHACQKARQHFRAAIHRQRFEQHVDLPPYPTEALCVGYVNGCNRAKIGYMKRRLIALALILAIGLQGSLTAFAAGIPVLQSDCQTSAESQGVAAKSCCPSGVHTTNCCLDTCVAVVAATASPVTLVLREPMVSAVHFRAASFFSRGDSPLIRPPIL
jgi:hypothetical protein